MHFIIYILALILFFGQNAYAEATTVRQQIKPGNEKTQKSIELTIKDIPKGQQTLFIPIQLDNMIVDIDKVSLEGLSSSNILAVTSNSMDKAGSGIGLIKFDDLGLPETLKLNVFLSSISSGTSDVSLLMVVDEPALPSKGLTINNEIMITPQINGEIEVTETIGKNNKKKLSINQNKVTINVQRLAQKQESIFIPIVFDTNVIDVDETFGYAILAPGLSAKAFSASTLNEGGSGIEILLTEVAEKDFSVDVDLLPKKAGKTKLGFALPQSSHTAIVRGPQVDIFPAQIIVNK